ncbi:hypothetical protein BV25DRAFT_1903897 [Artomyces pyxidatus]|uniref:Uncharacterized protein n=1 Tax=Artomyces pyxidatus TaxID=48021 RepID=A0ACB8SCV5_9AGAM|nr:hypothetical protein BV25DRAFT_1903897 [Artomyces pyxidatus]
MVTVQAVQNGAGTLVAIGSPERHLPGQDTKTELMRGQPRRNSRTASLLKLPILLETNTTYTARHEDSRPREKSRWTSCLGKTMYPVLVGLQAGVIWAAILGQGNMAERSKAPESGSGPKGREFESRCCHIRAGCDKLRPTTTICSIKLYYVTSQPIKIL